MTSSALSSLTRRMAAVIPPHCLAGSLCLGFAFALAARTTSIACPSAAVAAGMLAVADARYRLVFLSMTLFAAGWWLASVRLDSLDSSRLVGLIGRAATATFEVDGPARASAFALRLPVRVQTVWGEPMHERSELDLPASASEPPQGAILRALVTVRAPRAPTTDGGFDERSYLSHQGIHVVLRADRYRVIGHRGGLRGVADRIRAALVAGVAPGLSGERRALVEGLVLGQDQAVSGDLRQSFRNSGLYHLLAVSGQNVAYVAGMSLLLTWLIGLPRWAGELGALASICAYVLAVGWQPSVVRAGVAGVLASLAWLSARPRDRWYFALVGAATLLAWNPYSLFDAGFQLSFAAVAAIFLLVPRIEGVLGGYPLPHRLVTVVAVATACGVLTAPILWLQFGSVPVLTVVANALAEPVVAPILAFGLGAAALGPVSHGAAAALAWVNGWLAEYLAWCARSVGALPFARLTSSWAIAVLLGGLGVGIALRLVPPWWRRPLAAGAFAAAAGLAAWKL